MTNLLRSIPYHENDRALHPKLYPQVVYSYQSVVQQTYLLLLSLIISEGDSYLPEHRASVHAPETKPFQVALDHLGLIYLMCYPDLAVDSL